MSLELEDGVDRLEALLGRFIVQTEMAINEIRREGRRDNSDIFLFIYTGKLVNYLTMNKIYVMAIKEDTMDLINFEKISAET